jgi:hypothetical protein
MIKPYNNDIKFITHAWTLVWTVPEYTSLVVVRNVFVLSCIFPQCVCYSIIYMLQVFGWVRWCSADVRRESGCFYWCLCASRVRRKYVGCSLHVFGDICLIEMYWPAACTSLFVASSLLSLQIRFCLLDCSYRMPQSSWTGEFNTV